MLGILAKLGLGVATGGGSVLLSLLGTVLPGLASTIGDFFLKREQTQAAREGAQDTQGGRLANSWFAAVTEANRSRVEARKNEGAWGPLGLITMGVGSAIVFHVWWVALDSVPWSVFGLFDPHVVGSWRVSTWGKAGSGLDAVEMEAIRALFYTAPPAAAAVAIAKVFRR